MIQSEHVERGRKCVTCISFPQITLPGTIDILCAFYARASPHTFVYLPVFYDHDEVLFRVSDKIEVLQWVSVNQNQIRIGAFFDDAQFARIRITLTLIN